jgi:ATP-dependent helicase STH1/SNF2
MDAFRNQIFALRFLQKGEAIPAHIAAVIFNPPQPGSGSLTPPLPVTAKTEPQSVGTPSSSTLPSQLPNQQNIVPTPDAAPSAATSGPQSKEASVEPEVEIEEIPPTLIAPYNAYRDPRQVLAALRANVQAESIRTAPFIPSLMPAGLDPYSLQSERSRFLEARIAQRKRDLEAMPSLLGDGAAVDVDQLENLPAEQKLELLSSQKLKALIELKSLNLLQKQRQMREEVARGLNQAISLNLVTDRNAYRATRKITLKDARIVDQLERQQKIDRENRAKQKHVDQLLAIAKHGRAMEEAHNARKSKMQRLGKNILRWHVEAEKEEQKRIERISKERLKALKNNDEEAYMKLIDTAKDTRITHLLRQTDTFLDSLSQAVAVQQAEASDRDPMAMDGKQQDTTTAGEVDESAFGAVPVFEEEPQDKGKADYYNVAHRIKETVSEQPSILTGGTLKEYQIKGLQWMTSLYNNRLNGILADEMVRSLQMISSRNVES